MTKKLDLQGFEPNGGKVLVRVDFNVPLDNDRSITDDTRIKAALPTINSLLESGAAVILMSHLGRPKGKIDPVFSLRPVADRLAELLPCPVKFARDSVGPDAEKKVNGLRPGEILLLENLRFNPGETANDSGFSSGLAGLADYYVNDAFGSAHRAHASTVGVTAHFAECRAGFLMQRELEFMDKMLQQPDKPFVAVLGGAKVSGKIDVIQNLLGKVDTLLLGGGMIFTFLRVHGMNIGSSLFDEESVEVVTEITRLAKESSTQLVLPEDCIVATEFSEQADKREVLVTDIPDGWMGLDIGPKSVARYRAILTEAQSIFWNGPMGVFELPSFAGGTRGVCEAVAEASLEYMGGRELPGVKALSNE
jgi:phosphoglycerate kinase